MKNSWAQPSLSRDFALLSAAILFILFLISLWVTYTTYTRHAEQVSIDMEKESLRIERTLDNILLNADYMLTSLGKQIVLDPDRGNMVKLAQVLKSYDSKDYVYSIISWVNTDQQLVVSSNKGVLDKPVDISDRDYVKKAFTDPWKMAVGRPIEGRVSGRWVIPVAMGLTDYTGKFIGTIQISLDINTVTDEISGLIKRDGISFAIVSKTLIRIIQVSDDPDFVSNNFPTQKLVSVNFSKAPSGMIAQGSLFWGTRNYAYYRVLQDYPYIVLLGYDTHYTDESVRGLLWSRLLQMLVMAVFFVLFLWIVRVRMIKPILDMTGVAAGITRGETDIDLGAGGPMEIEGLAVQLHRVAEYINENKRIEQELRNKMFMLRRAKERAELDKRSKAEFLAYVCQEMHVPLNNIIGFAQVMKDQLYGPIENRKYRQYASDIYSTSTSIMDDVQDLLTLAKAETDYIELSEKPLDVAGIINRSLKFVSDKMQVEKLGVRQHLQENLPRLVADEFRLQQILMNALLYVLGHTLPGGSILLEARVVSENRDKVFFAFVISTADKPPYTADQLTALAERLMFTPSYPPAARNTDVLKDHTDLSIELARILILLHGGALDISRTENGTVTVVIFFGGGRIRQLEA